MTAISPTCGRLTAASNFDIFLFYGPSASAITSQSVGQSVSNLVGRPVGWLVGGVAKGVLFVLPVRGASGASNSNRSVTTHSREH